MPVGESAEDTRLKRLLDELYLRDPCLGSRRLVTVLERDHGQIVNRKRLQRLRREMGVEAIYCKPRMSIPDKSHRIYPYLLRDLAISWPDQVWCAAICFAPPHGAHPSGAACGWLPRLRARRGLNSIAQRKILVEKSRSPPMFTPLT